MRHIHSRQLTSGTSPASPPLPTVLGISSRQLDTIDPIAAPLNARDMGVLDEIGRIEAVLAASLAGNECAFLDIDGIPPHPTLADLVRGTPSTVTLAQLVDEIEEDPFRFAVRMWNAETFARQLHDRVTRLESRERMRTA